MQSPASVAWQLPNYPISEIFSEFQQSFKNTPLLIEAEPGAGKSTIIPLWALNAVPVDTVIWLIQPRILSARNVASRLSVLIDQELGASVGYQTPYDSRTSNQTRLIVMTPGILLQHLLSNPDLDGVGCVILDECHERSVNQDLAWAFLQEIQILRDDLKLVLMSATPDPALKQQIPNYLFSPGRCFPVSLEYLPAKQQSGQYSEKIEDHLLRALRHHSQWQNQTVLVFLPGWGEIDKCAQSIANSFPVVKVFRLHSRVSAPEQQEALDPKQGCRIILATNIAETSLTVADVTLVIDTGLTRRVNYEQRTGISRLSTSRISSASAEQRRGRAGRVRPGHCIRLWPQDQPLTAADLPEIRATDYLPLALRIAHWGSPDESLPWLERPNRFALDFAYQQLRKMGLLNEGNSITKLGEHVSELGTHPRISSFLLLHSDSISRSSLLLALALHFELPTEQGIEELVEIAEVELSSNPQWQKQQNRWLKVMNAKIHEGIIDANLLARAFSDRIGYRQESGKYRLNSGISVDSKLTSQWAVLPIIVTKHKGHFGVGIAVQLNSDMQRQLSQHQTQLEYKQQRWQQRTTWRMGGVIIDDKFAPLIDSEVLYFLVKYIQQQWQDKGMGHFRWNDIATRLLQRARLLVDLNLCELPALDDIALCNSLEEWLGPFLTATTQLDNLPWLQGLEYYLGYEACLIIAKLLPEKIDLPSGRSVAIEFTNEGGAKIAAKLQEFFGCEQLQLANGKIPLQIHLLSPNGSPLAITTNLQTFWQQAYSDIRKEMRGRYPRHPWPENPLEHEATALTKRKIALRNNELN